MPTPDTAMEKFKNKAASIVYKIVDDSATLWTPAMEAKAVEDIRQAADELSKARVREAAKKTTQTIVHHRLYGAAWILRELLKRPHEDINYLTLEDSYKQAMDQLAGLDISKEVK